VRWRKSERGITGLVFHDREEPFDVGAMEFSSRGTLNELVATFHNHGMDIVARILDTEGDGNCFYHALGTYLSTMVGSNLSQHPEVGLLGNVVAKSQQSMRRKPTLSPAMRSRAAFLRWVALRAHQCFFPENWIRVELPDQPQARSPFTEGLPEHEGTAWSSVTECLLSMLDPQDSDYAVWWSDKHHAEGRSVAVLMACMLGVSINIVDAHAEERGGADWEFKPAATQIGFKWREWDAWCQSEEAARLESTGCRVRAENGDYRPDLVIQALHQRQQEQLDMLIAEDQAFREADGNDGLTLYERAASALHGRDVDPSNIWVGVPTRWLQTMIHVQTLTVSGQRVDSPDRMYREFWGEALIRGTASTYTHTPDGMVVVAPQVIPIIDYTVSVTRDVEIGHYVNFSDVNGALDEFRGDTNASERHVAYTADRLAELLREYNTHGKDEIARMWKEVQASRRSGKRKSEAAVAERIRKSGRLAHGESQSCK
jgi:hypothetical protein